MEIKKILLFIFIMVSTIFAAETSFSQNSSTDTSGNSDGEQVSNLPLIIAGVGIAGTVGGIIIGSLLSYWGNRKAEERRIKEEHRKEEEFNSRIRELVLLELKNYSNLLDGLLYTPEASIEEYKVGWKVVVKNPSLYTSISLERRVSIFNARALTEVENAYYWLDIFKEGFPLELDRYLNKQITIEQLRYNLGADQKKSFVDKARKAIEEEHP